MAEDLDQIERVLKRLREAGTRDDQMEALLGRINVALS